MGTAAPSHQHLRPAARGPSPRQPGFVDEILVPLAARAAAGEDRRTLVDELYEHHVHPWAMRQARAQVVGLPPHADASEVVSQVLRLAWEACLRIDWERLESWSTLLERKVSHARTEAARTDDWLSRRERVYRRRFQRAVAQSEQQRHRALTPDERVEIAATVAPSSARVDWVKELLAARHPSSVADVPDEVLGDDVGLEVETRLLDAERARCLRAWLAAIALQEPRLADDLLRWCDTTDSGDRVLPVRLARRVEPFAPLLLGMLWEAA
jgi:hypothetical protein